MDVIYPPEPGAYHMGIFLREALLVIQLILNLKEVIPW